jgi:hypothetical protein
MPVEWKASALDMLAAIHVTLSLDGQHELEQAVLRINARLARDPWTPGESRGPNDRVWFHPPLVVSYRLLSGGGVAVYHVAKLGPRRPDADDD